MCVETRIQRRTIQVTSIYPILLSFTLKTYTSFFSDPSLNEWHHQACNYLSQKHTLIWDSNPLSFSLLQFLRFTFFPAISWSIALAHPGFLQHLPFMTLPSALFPLVSSQNGIPCHQHMRLVEAIPPIPYVPVIVERGKECHIGQSLRPFSPSNTSYASSSPSSICLRTGRTGLE